MQIRTLQAADLPFLREFFIQIRKQTFYWLPNQDYQLSDFDHQIRGEKVLVAVNDDQILGFISIYQEDNFVHHLYVVPLRQKSGVGAALLQAAELSFTGTGSLKCLAKNQPALQFYQRQGWQNQGQFLTGDNAYILLHKPKE